MNYYWKNGEREKKRKKKEKKSFPPQGLNPRRLHINQGPYRLAICQFKSDIKFTVYSYGYFVQCKRRECFRHTAYICE